MDKHTLQSAFVDLRSFIEAVMVYDGPESVRLNGAIAKEGDDSKCRRFWLQDNGSVSAETDPSHRHPAV